MGSFLGGWQGQRWSAEDWRHLGQLLGEVGSDADCVVDKCTALEPVEVAQGGQRALGRTVTVLHSANRARFLKRDCRQSRAPFGAVAEALFSADAGEGSMDLWPQLRELPFYARAPLETGLLSECQGGLRAIETMLGEPAKADNCGVWLGSAGNITPFHYDLCHGSSGRRQDIHTCGAGRVSLHVPA